MSNKNNKVYYGEYSLERWINLILSKKIVLPPYQRYFVWSEKQATRLIRSIDNSFFLPAVTLGVYKDDNSKNVNMLLDGQQRLTSVILAYIGRFPNKIAPDRRLHFALENGEEDDNVEDDRLSEWTFKHLQDIGDTKDVICNRIDVEFADQYKKFEVKKKDGTVLQVNSEFLHSHFINFAYIVSDANAGNEKKTILY